MVKNHFKKRFFKKRQCASELSVQTHVSVRDVKSNERLLRITKPSQHENAVSFGLPKDFIAFSDLPQLRLGLCPLLKN